MAINLNTATIRHERRVRLGFTNTLAGAAFTSVSYYTVESLDSAAPVPLVVKAFLISDSPNFVELQLDTDLAPGAPYRFNAVAVPAADLSVTPNPSYVDARMASPKDSAALAAAPAPVSALEETLYGRDLRWTGSDFAEGPGGDLAMVGGAECVERDLYARMLSNGLPWDPSFGLKAREYVDGSPTTLPNLRGRAISQLRQDDRVSSAAADVDISDPAEPILEVTPTLVGSGISRSNAPLQLRVDLL